MGALSGIYGIVQDSTIAGNMSRAKENEANVRGTKLQTGDDTPLPNEVIYIYNLLDMEHTIHQPPFFPALRIHACPKDQVFSFTRIPRFIKERYERPGSVEYYFKNVDGRKYATSLLNPSAFPGVKWEAQLQAWRSTDQFGNNLNAWGCFWSLEKPLLEEDKTPSSKQSPTLEEQMRLFRARFRTTAEDMVRQAESLAASNSQASITPKMHFCMDYLRRQASWHMRTEFLVDCPTCGEPVKEGIAYHRNSMNFVCPVDVARCKELGIQVGMATMVAPPAPVAPVPLTAGMSDEEAELVRAASAGADREEDEIKRTKKAPSSSRPAPAAPKRR